MHRMFDFCIFFGFLEEKCFCGFDSGKIEYNNNWDGYKKYKKYSPDAVTVYCTGAVRVCRSEKISWRTQLCHHPQCLLDQMHRSLGLP
jgi:hypothetical protein